MTARRSLCSLVLAAAVLCAASPLAHADDASKRHKIGELFTLIQIDKTMQQVATQQVTQAQRAMKTMFPDAKISPDQQKDLDAFLQKILAITQQSLSWSKLQPQFTDLYASTYTEEEIDGMIAFYRSPVGTAMIARQPEILSKSQAISQAQLAEVQPQLRAAILQFVQQMGAKYPGGGAAVHPRD